MDNWVRGRNQNISELKGDTTLTKEQVLKVQMELDWERARNNRIAQDQTAALARVEEKIAKPLQSTQHLEELEATVAKNLQEARAESVSTTADIRRGIRNFLTRPPVRPTAQDLFDAQDASKLQRQTGLDIGAILEAHEALPQGGNGGKEPPKVLTVPAGNPDDSDPSSEPTTPRMRPSPLPRRNRLSSEEEEDMSMNAFARIVASAFHQLKKEDEDSGKRISLKAP